MSEARLRSLLRHHPVIAILRGLPDDQLLPTVEALERGGVRLVEVALRTPDDLRRVAQVAGAFPALMVGAGTITSASLAETAVRHGATFLLTPHVAEDAVRAAAELGVPIIPGAFTPTEIQRCLTLGCAAVKLFPAHLGGPEYLRALRAPYPDLPLIAVGGVTPGNLHDYLRAGAVGVGMGGQLVPPSRLPDYAAIQERARACALLPAPPAPDPVP